MLISIISTFYNEEENINFFYEQIKSQIEKKNRKYEFIFINDSSTDKSKELVNKICEKDRNVKLINTSRTKYVMMFVVVSVFYRHCLDYRTYSFTYSPFTTVFVAYSALYSKLFK